MGFVTSSDGYIDLIAVHIYNAIVIALIVTGLVQVNKKNKVGLHAMITQWGKIGKKIQNQCKLTAKTVRLSQPRGAKVLLPYYP